MKYLVKNQYTNNANKTYTTYFVRIVESVIGRMPLFGSKKEAKRYETHAPARTMAQNLGDNMSVEEVEE